MTAQLSLLDPRSVVGSVAAILWILVLLTIVRFGVYLVKLAMSPTPVAEDPSPDHRERGRAPVLQESEVVVTVDDRGLSARYPDGATQQIAWSDVTRVTIETNDTGPWGSDVWWIVEGPDAECTYPLGATGEDKAMDAYRDRFPGFDWEELIRAQTSTDNATFVCWERRGPG